MIKAISITAQLCLSTLSIALCHTAHAQATFVIWPIYPKIEAQEKATAVWLENTGKTDSMIQIRVFKWQQQDNKDQYQAQNEVIPSPPIAKIKAGEKYMLRLTRPNATLKNTETAYRIIVDELPIQLDDKAAVSNVNFQMRYSIPLFSYGEGIGSGLDEESAKANLKNGLAKPILHYWLKNDERGRSQLYIQNTGLKFARITGVNLEKNSPQIPFQDISFGYILAGSTMRFDLNPKEAQQLALANKIYATDRSGNNTQVVEIDKISR